MLLHIELPQAVFDEIRYQVDGMTGKGPSSFGGRVGDPVPNQTAPIPSPASSFPSADQVRAILQVVREMIPEFFGVKSPRPAAGCADPFLGAGVPVHFAEAFPQFKEDDLNGWPAVTVPGVLLKLVDLRVAADTPAGLGEWIARAPRVLRGLADRIQSGRG